MLLPMLEQDHLVYCSDGRSAGEAFLEKRAAAYIGINTELPLLADADFEIGCAPVFRGETDAVPARARMLAVTTSAINGIGMGLSTTLVLALSNLIISLLRNIIPDRVRMPAFIVIVASFVTIVQFLLQGYVPSLYSSLGIYIPLIVVNCIILGRAESYASKNPPIPSLFDGLGMGIGFTFTLVIMGSIRELIGAGTWCGIPVLSRIMPGMSIMTLVPGGFFVYAIVMAFVHYITEDKSKIKDSFGCDGCANADDCIDGSGCAKEEVA